MISRASSSERSLSQKIFARMSSNTVSASEKLTPCFRRLALSYRESRSGNYGQSVHIQFISFLF